jgi:SSS family solute:Na+ symporter
MSAAITTMIFGIPIYGMLLWLFPEIAFLNHMAITFGILVLTMAIFTIVKPLPEPVVFKSISTIDATPSVLAKWCGIGVIIVTIFLYIIFW